MSKHEQLCILMTSWQRTKKINSKMRHMSLVSKNKNLIILSMKETMVENDAQLFSTWVVNGILTSVNIHSHAVTR